MVEVSLGLPGLAEFIPESARALRGHFGRSRGGTLSQEAVREYFAHRSSTGDDHFPDVIASASRSYRQLLHASQSLITPSLTELNEPRVLDYGCGQAGLLHLLREWSNGFQYTGFDIDTPTIRRLNATLSGACFVEGLPSTQFDIVFLINVLAYTSDAEIQSLLADVAIHLKPRGLLVVAEPVPAWYWETNFANLSLRLRSHNEVSESFAQHGLVPDGANTASISSVRGRKILPIAWLGTWKHHQSIGVDE